MRDSPAAEPGRTPTLAPQGRDWRWALVLVACLHLLTTAGMWHVTDHGEMLTVAKEILHHGRVTAGPPAAPARKDTLRPTRFVPATSLTLLPLLVVDELLGWGEPGQFGRLVHLQGHIFILWTLALLGRSVARAGGSPAASAAAVLFTGFAWPVWMVALRLGPEPLLLWLTLLFAVSDPDLDGTHPRARALVCAALPWCHATGPLMSLALISGAFLERRLSAPGEGLDRTLKAFSPLLAASALGISSFLLVWNYLYSGSLWYGGYSDYNAVAGILGVRPFHEGLYLYIRALALEALPLLGLAVAGALKAGSGGFKSLVIPACVTAALVALFATFQSPEPERRLAVVYPLWGFAVGRGWAALGLRRTRALVLMVAAALMGFAGWLGTPGFFYKTPDGWLFLPVSLWAREALRGEWAVAGAAVVTLGLGAAFAASRVARLFWDAPVAAGASPAA